MEPLASKSAGRGPLSETQKLMVQGAAVFMALVLVGGTLGGGPTRAMANTETSSYTGTVATREISRLRWSLDSATGELELTQLQLSRAKAVLDFSAGYHIPADLASLIYDTSVREGIDPTLAFRIINVESEFKASAVSPVGAVGLTQVMLPTAVLYQPGITQRKLLDPTTNLKIGFRYLYDLLTKYDGDLRLALVAYNRGPAKVNALLGLGQNPQNGYSERVTKGYKRSTSPIP
jgi:hypothetical protein